jgi:hypothetical protein
VVWLTTGPFRSVADVLRSFVVEKSCERSYVRIVERPFFFFFFWFEGLRVAVFGGWVVCLRPE